MRVAHCSRIIVLCASAAFLSGCPHNVNLTLKNTATQDLAPPIQLTHQGIPETPIGVGTVSPNATETKTVKLDDGDSYVVKAALPGSAIVFKTDPKTITAADPK